MAAYTYIDFGENKMNPFSITTQILVSTTIAVTFGIYPLKDIDANFGGMRIEKKCLLFTDSARRVIQSTPLRDSLLQNQTKPVVVVYQTESSYYIYLADSLTLNINKSLFFGEFIYKP